MNSTMMKESEHTHTTHILHTDMSVCILYTLYAQKHAMHTAHIRTHYTDTYCAHVLVLHIYAHTHTAQKHTHAQTPYTHTRQSHAGQARVSTS